MVHPTIKAMLRRFLYVGLALCMSALPACQQDPQPEMTEPKSKLVVGFSQIGAESAWRTRNTFSMKEEAKKQDIQLIFMDAEQKQENQIKAIYSFIAYQVDVIILAPIVETGWDNALDKAKEAGIPVIVSDRSIQTEDESLYSGFVGSDFYESGREAGRFLLKKFQGVTDPIIIYEMMGTDNSTPAIERHNGFVEVLRGHPQFRIRYSEMGDFLRSKGKELMTDQIARGTPIDVLYCHNDAMALGAVDAMEEAGMRPGKDVVIVSIDAEQEAVDAVREGKMNCVIECNPNLGEMAMELAQKLHRGESIPQKTYTDIQVFSEWDDLTAIPERGY